MVRFLFQKMHFRELQIDMQDCTCCWKHFDDLAWKSTAVSWATINLCNMYFDKVTNVVDLSATVMFDVHFVLHSCTIMFKIIVGNLAINVMLTDRIIGYIL